MCILKTLYHQPCRPVVLLVFLASAFLLVESAIQTTNTPLIHYVKDADFNLISPLKKTTVRSKTECAVICTRNPACTSWIFHTGSLECAVNTDVFDVNMMDTYKQSGPGLIPLGEYKTLGRVCSSSSSVVCLEATTLCDAVCSCPVCFVFSTSQNVCVVSSNAGDDSAGCGDG